MSAFSWTATHVRSASFYDIDAGYAWIAQVSTEMSHFENDRDVSARVLG